MELLKLISTVIFLLIILVILCNTEIIAVLFEALFAVILFIPRKLWNFLDEKKRLIITYILSLILFITVFYFNNFKIKVHGDYTATLMAISLSTIIIIPLIKFVERLDNVFAPGRSPFWMGYSRFIPKDQTVKEASADFLLNWLVVPVVCPLVGFLFYSIFRLSFLLGKDILSYF